MSPDSLVNAALGVLALVGGAAVIAPVVLARRFTRYCAEFESNNRPVYQRNPDAPKLVSCILPCKGIDPGFEQNIATIFEQDLPDKELVFATATDDDPACGVIRDAMSRYPHVKARLVHAGLPDSCSQQNNNQLAAAAAARPESQVFVVMDSDIQLRPDYLRRLIEPLSDPAVLAATGYRWYSPVTGGVGSWLRSVWNAGALVFMPDTLRNFAWGGSMAFRRGEFDHATLKSLWGSTLSDDHTLTAEVRRRGGRVVFVPQCMAVSYEDSRLSETIGWTTRQTLVTRVYNAAFWWSVLIVHGLQNIATALGVVALIAWCLGAASNRQAIAGALLLLPLTGMWLGSLILRPAIAGILPPKASSQLTAKAWIYLVLTPAASLLCLWNSLASRLTSDMTWRGVTYRMVSPSKTIVLKG